MRSHSFVLEPIHASNACLRMTEHGVSGMFQTLPQHKLTMSPQSHAMIITSSDKPSSENQDLNPQLPTNRLRQSGCKWSSICCSVRGPLVAPRVHVHKVSSLVLQRASPRSVRDVCKFAAFFSVLLRAACHGIVACRERRGDLCFRLSVSAQKAGRSRRVAGDGVLREVAMLGFQRIFRNHQDQK